MFSVVLSGQGAQALARSLPNFAAASSADSLALYVGGGVNLHLKRGLALRAVEANWLRTQLPNATTNVQNNLRLGAGLTYTFK